MSSDESDDFESAGEEEVEASVPKSKAKATGEQFSTPISKVDKVEQLEAKVNQLSVGDEDADGWGDDNWGDDAEETQKPSEKVAEKVEDDGNWSDFDDWGETESPKKSATKKSEDISKSMFPVLDEISPSKETTRPEGFLSGFTKTNSVSASSNYEAFPVLNDLGSKRPSVGEQPQTPVEQNQPNTPKEDTSANSGWGWSPWGGTLSSIISTATEGVTSITSQVSQGFSTVIENSMGVPDPEELARFNKERLQQSRQASTEEQPAEDETAPENVLPSFGHLMTGVTSIGNKVLTGGLDTLEGIGKKTMTILQENDPLLLNKRKMLGIEQNKPVLSQVLREAKEKSDEVEKNLKQMQKHSYKKHLHFESLFDNYYGLVHLEALEMLSKQSAMKLQSLLEPLSGKALVELQETLNEVKELCDLGEVENEDADGKYSAQDLQEKFDAAVEDLGIQIEFAEILKCWETNRTWLTENDSATVEEVYEKGLRCLAETCALTICKMHKIAEMLLIQEHHSTANEADSLVQLTLAFCAHVSAIANLFGSKLNAFEKTEEVSKCITNIFVEVCNSTTYIQNAFQLLIPILQIGAA